MIGWILGLINIARAFWSLYQEYKTFKREQERLADFEKSKSLTEAIEKAKKAKTPEEAWDAQKGIVDNSN